MFVKILGLSRPGLLKYILGFFLWTWAYSELIGDNPVPCGILVRSRSSICVHLVHVCNNKFDTGCDKYRKLASSYLFAETYDKLFHSSKYVKWRASDVHVCLSFWRLRSSIFKNAIGKYVCKYVWPMYKHSKFRWMQEVQKRSWFSTTIFGQNFCLEVWHFLPYRLKE